MRYTPNLNLPVAEENDFKNDYPLNVEGPSKDALDAVGYGTAMKANTGTSLSSPVAGTVYALSVTDTWLEPTTSALRILGGSIQLAVPAFVRLDYVVRFHFTGDSWGIGNTFWDTGAENDYYQPAAVHYASASNTRCVAGCAKNGVSMSHAGHTRFWASGADIASFGACYLQVTVLKVL